MLTSSCFSVRVGQLRKCAAAEGFIAGGGFAEGAAVCHKPQRRSDCGTKPAVLTVIEPTLPLVNIGSYTCLLLLLDYNRRAVGIILALPRTLDQHCSKRLRHLTRITAVRAVDARQP